MADAKKLVVIISQGLDNERSSVAWSVAIGGINSGLDVTVFLVSSGVDWVRKGAADGVHLNPFDPPMKELVDAVMKDGTVLACPPCSKVRGYTEESYLDGVVITGSGAVHELIKQDAAVVSF